MNKLNEMTNKQLAERISSLELAPDTYVNGEITDHRAELAEAVSRLSEDGIDSQNYTDLVKAYVDTLSSLCNLQRKSNNVQLIKHVSHTISGLSSAMLDEITTRASGK